MIIPWMKSIRLLVITPLLFLCACAGAPQAEPEQEKKDRGEFEVLHYHLKSRMAISADCSAGAALVMRDGKVIYEEYLGTVHRGPGAAPVTGRSRFPFYSLSKGFGSAVVLSLATEGLIDLDDPVCKYLPDFKGPGPNGKYLREHVKISHLASHTSGVTQEKSSYDSYDGSSMFGDVTLEFEPGTEFRYGELAMRILGQVLEIAGGKPYDRLLQERILDPLGLNSVGFLKRGADTVDVVHTCAGFDSSHIAYSNRHSAKTKATPGFGLFGNVRDIGRYAQLWLDGGRVGDRLIFHEELIKEAWSTQPPGRRPDPDYGILFWLFPRVKSYVFSGAGHSICAILPERKMVLVMGLNQRGGGVWDFQTEKINLANIGHAIAERLDR
ncbi:MAG: serine hydrolase domain-containing protein [Gemmatimonadota bacterium]|nr:serine hydrolase domain-containing protein [Gemmatimonadota bacterium]